MHLRPTARAISNEEAKMTANTNNTNKRQAETSRGAVIGTGIMGSAMARNLVAAGFRTTEWDRSASATAPLAELGARVAASPEEAVGEAAVVITMLST